MARPGRPITWKTAKRRPPKIPSLHGAERIPMPDGTYETWARVRADYHQQVEGLGYSGRRLKADLAAKRRDFESVAQAAWLVRKGYAAKASNRLLGFSENGPVKGWMAPKAKRKLPVSISEKKHRFHYGSRRVPDLSTSDKHAFGYFLGLPATQRVNIQRNRQTGQSVFSVHTSSRTLARHIARVVGSAIGIEPKVRTQQRRGAAQRPDHIVLLASTNLPKTLPSAFFEDGHVAALVPDHPQSRLGFTRASFDLGHAPFRVSRGVRSLHFMHDNPAVVAVVSKALSEQGVGHRRKGNLLTIPRNQFPAFKEKIGLRDPKRRAMLSG